MILNSPSTTSYQGSIHKSGWGVGGLQYQGGDSFSLGRWKYYKTAKRAYFLIFPNPHRSLGPLITQKKRSPSNRFILLTSLCDYHNIFGHYILQAKGRHRKECFSGLNNKRRGVVNPKKYSAKQKTKIIKAKNGRTKHEPLRYRGGGVIRPLVVRPLKKLYFLFFFHSQQT